MPPTCFSFFLLRSILAFILFHLWWWIISIVNIIIHIRLWLHGSLASGKGRSWLVVIDAGRAGGGGSCGAKGGEMGWVWIVEYRLANHVCRRGEWSVKTMRVESTWTRGEMGVDEVGIGDEGQRARERSHSCVRAHYCIWFSLYIFTTQISISYYRHYMFFIYFFVHVYMFIEYMYIYVCRFWASGT